MNIKLTHIEHDNCYEIVRTTIDLVGNETIEYIRYRKDLKYVQYNDDKPMVASSVAVDRFNRLYKEKFNA